MNRFAVSPELLAQDQALHEAVGYGSIPERTLISLRGNDRQSLIHNLCTQDVKRLKPGEGCEALLLTPQGRLLAHVLLRAREDELLLEAAAGQADKLLAHLDRYTILEDAQATDLSASHQVAIVAGPRAAKLLQSRFIDPLPASRLGHAAARNNTARALLVGRYDIWGPHAWCFIGSRAALQEVDWALAAHDGVPLEDSLQRPVPVDFAALEILRVEAGWPEFGRDVTLQQLPQELARDAQAICLTKGCYLGQETVARIDALGHVNWLLRGVRFLSAEQPPSLPCPLSHGEKHVGSVTSCVYSPRQNAWVGMGLLRREVAEPGTLLATNAGDAAVFAFPANAH